MWSRGRALNGDGTKDGTPGGYFHARRIQDTHGRYHAFRFPRNYFSNERECVSWRLYGKKDSVAERHRHRYEVNPEMVDELEQKGLKFVGKDETGTRMEICELAKHPFYVACQYHPEFKSRPGRPSPMFMGLLLAASGQLESYISDEAVELRLSMGNMMRSPMKSIKAAGLYVGGMTD